MKYTNGIERSKQAAALAKKHAASAAQHVNRSGKKITAYASKIVTGVLKWARANISKKAVAMVALASIVRWYDQIIVKGVSSVMSWLNDRLDTEIMFAVEKIEQATNWIGRMINKVFRHDGEKIAAIGDTIWGPVKKAIDVTYAFNNKVIAGYVKVASHKITKSVIVSAALITFVQIGTSALFGVSLLAMFATWMSTTVLVIEGTFAVPLYFVPSISIAIAGVIQLGWSYMRLRKTSKVSDLGVSAEAYETEISKLKEALATTEGELAAFANTEVKRMRTGSNQAPSKKAKGRGFKEIKSPFAHIEPETA